MALEIGIGGQTRGGASSAEKVRYDNTTSGLTATTVQGAIDEVAANLGEITKVTYSQLKQLRDTSKLISGHWYRLTDYDCKIVETNSIKSANNQFDILILATDKNTLSENCFACRHEGDTYFPQDTNFSAWVLKYNLNNDYTKFNNVKNSGVQSVEFSVDLDLTAYGLGSLTYYGALAEIVSTTDTTIQGFPIKAHFIFAEFDTVLYMSTSQGDIVYACTQFNGQTIGPIPLTNVKLIDSDYSTKGYISYLKDEHGNEANFDFKNILKPRYKIIDFSTSFKNNRISSVIEKDTEITLDWDSLSDGKSSIIGFYSTHSKDFELDTTPLWCYLFSYYNDEEVFDVSIKRHTIPSSDGVVAVATNNSVIYNYMYGTTTISDTVFLLDNTLITEIGGLNPPLDNKLGDICNCNTFGYAFNCNFNAWCTNNVIRKAYNVNANGNFGVNYIYELSSSIFGESNYCNTFFGSVSVCDFSCNAEYITLFNEGTSGCEFTNGARHIITKCKTFYDNNISGNKLLLLRSTNGDITGNTIEPNANRVFATNPIRCRITSSVYGSATYEGGVIVTSNMIKIPSNKCGSGSIITRNSSSEIVSFNLGDIAPSNS